MAAKIKKDDTVQILSGRDRGRRGDVRHIINKKGRAIVDGLNIVKRHRRSRSAQEASEIVEMESPIDLSNLSLVCHICDKPTRVGFRFLNDERKVRFCKRCEESID
ncbi:MAG: 50S ribosomal protein L24 [Chloroflexi bacterium]|nr:50S ribosomal protein L24 [Chloroflexota bacterium]